MPSVLLWPQTDNMGGVLSFPRAMSHFTRGASTDDAVGGNATSHAAKPMPDAAHSCASASQSLGMWALSSISPNFNQEVGARCCVGLLS